MIRTLTLRNFKRFKEVEFLVPGHVVFAGPNNAGKTTALQAIAAWGLALDRWRQRHDMNPRQGFTKVPIARQAFTAVPLRDFDLLWRDRVYRQPIEIEIQDTKGWKVCMEFIPDTSEQILVRPTLATTPYALEQASLETVFVPPMSGLETEEPLYARREFVNLRLSQGRPGEVLRNILVEANGTAAAWTALTRSIKQLFGYTLIPPETQGAHIVAEYESVAGGPRFDVGSAGSGFQQVLMLLTYLNARPGAVLLLDEPDAHLHVILQAAIYTELRAVAARQGSQLIIATHSEVVIDSVEPEELCVFLAKPQMLIDSAQRQILKHALKVLSNTEIMLGEAAKGVLYVEGFTDMELLRTWAHVLGHRSDAWFSSQFLWRPAESGGEPRKHLDALRLIKGDLRGIEIRDRDGNLNLTSPDHRGPGLDRLYWDRYEIESYLVHPQAVARFVRGLAGEAGEREATNKLRAIFDGVVDGLFANPHQPPAAAEAILKTIKARTEIIDPVLSAGGLQGFPYTRYHEIAQQMTPDEVHPEVVQKLDAIAEAFGL